MSAEGPEGWAGPLYGHVLDATGTGAGTTLLDLGCGPGEFARLAAARGAVVTGIDVDPSAVGMSAARAPGATFLVGDAADPPAGPFDVVAAVQLLAHVPDPLVVLRAAAARGAVVAVTVWGREEECDVRAFGEALAPWLPPRRRPPSGAPTATDPDRLRQLVETAGLTVTSLDEVVCPFTYPGADELVGPLMTSGIGRHAMNRGGPAAVREAVLERLSGNRQEDGTYVLRNLFRVLVARP